MSMRAKGTFEVTLVPQPSEGTTQDATLGEPRLAVTVVPDSGSGQLVGLAGSMVIIIAAGLHSYEFEYTLP